MGRVGVAEGKIHDQTSSVAERTVGIKMIALAKKAVGQRDHVATLCGILSSDGYAA